LVNPVLRVWKEGDNQVRPLCEQSAWANVSGQSTTNPKAKTAYYGQTQKILGDKKRLNVWKKQSRKSFKKEKKEKNLVQQSEPSADKRGSCLSLCTLNRVRAKNQNSKKIPGTLVRGEKHFAEKFVLFR